MAEQAVPIEQEPYAGGMDTRAPKRVRVTVRLSPERLERARKAVQWGYASSLSAWIEEAVRKHDSNYGWCETEEEAFAEAIRECGPFTEDEVACLRREMLGP